MHDAPPLDPALSAIQDLERRAEQVKSLIEGSRAPRPLIVEFSGLPKSGKTSTISILQHFLKRNGIKAEVYTERASIAPIKKKMHLDFNVWVSCASLEGMLEALHKEVDVFILDRGIFDALVWNEWLEMTGRITPDEGLELEKFFMMKRWTNLVDLVFVFRCDPDVSLAREEKYQLTTKPGSIMEKSTLVQLNECINKTMTKNGVQFKKIVEMDTTGTDNPQQTAIPVAQATLDALNGLVDETICVVPASSVSSLLPASGLVSDPAIVKAFLEAVKSDRKFILRSQAEKDPNYLQPIPCAVIEYGSQVLLLRRNKKGHPLHDTYVVWAGGHVNISDDGPEILLNALRREITEELFITDVFKLDSEPIALIRTQEDARAALHIAVLYRVTLTSNNVALAMDQKEFRETRGSSMSGRLVDLDTITEFYDRMRNWSRFIIGHLWPDKVPVGPQGTLFKN